jgi:MtN3 and saliva related transmembrane protein
MDFVTAIGLLAGTLTTVSFVPQVLKTWKTRSAKDISLEMFLTFCAGVLLWIVYGIYTRQLPVIVPNVATFILASTILVFKVKYR